MSRISVFAGLPTYDGTRHNGRALGDLLSLPDAVVMDTKASILTRNFNQCWATALDLRDQRGVDWFLLLHADVVPEHAGWLEALIGEAERLEADVVSAIIPLKNHEGLTSTALDTDEWNPRRLAMREVMDRSVSFTEPDLLVNTGMLLVNFRRAWPEDICFTIRDRIVRRDGRRQAECEPEDWSFSRQARALGVTLWATRAIPVRHYGVTHYANTHAWGSKTTDAPALQTTEAR